MLSPANDAIDFCKLAVNKGDSRGSGDAAAEVKISTAVKIPDDTETIQRQPTPLLADRLAIPDNLVQTCNRTVGGQTGSTV